MELGTLTGFSAALLTAVLARRYGPDFAGVDTIDARAACLIDETKPTGFEIPELIPDLASFSPRARASRFLSRAPTRATR